MSPELRWCKATYQFWIVCATAKIFCRALNEEQVQRLYKLHDDTNPNGRKKYSIKETCEMMGISKSTLYAYLEQRKAQE